MSMRATSRRRSADLAGVEGGVNGAEFVRRARRELKPGTLRGMWKQLGIREEDF